MEAIITSPGLERVAAMLTERRDDLAAATLSAIQAQCPGYAAIDDPVILTDVQEHVAQNHDALCASILRGRPVTSEDLAFIRPHAALRARRGLPVSDFLHAFRIGHRVLWEAIAELAETDEQARAAGMTAARLVMVFIDHASTHAAQSYLEAQQLLLAEGDRVRRDLLEDLLAGHELTPGPRLAAARAAGLDGGGACQVVVAVPVTTCPGDDELALRSAASALARAMGGVLRPLTVVRQNEIVVVRALAGQGGGGVSEPLRRVWREQADGGLGLAIGLSTVFETTAALPEAYREACAAVQSIGLEGGVMALPDLRALDYLALRADDTARRLIRPEVRSFVAEDAASGGVLIKTLLAYAEADLNAKVAAQRLYVHVNTAHHRLSRIEEKTACDLRRLGDVEDLLLAVRLLAP